VKRWAALALFAVSVWSMIVHPWGWAFGIGVHPYPESSSTPWTYQLYSGFLPALTVLTLLGSVLSLWHLHNCHQDRCWRLGKHRVDGTPWCSRHQGRARTQTQVTLDDVVARLDQLIAAVEEKRRWPW
jgi:hypothetical protein